MKEQYNSSYSPPIPVLEVRLYSSLADKFSGPFSAILDTGSDATLVPMAALVAIGAEETAPGWMIGITGNRQAVPLYFVDVVIGNLGFPGIRAIGDENSQELILGRDVLNKLPLFLDGAQQQTTLLDDAIVNRIRSS